MKTKQSFVADSKQQVDPIKRKNVANLNKPLFIKKNKQF